MLDLTFQYNLDNLQASILNISSLNSEALLNFAILFGGFIFLSLLYKAGLYIYGYILVSKERREKEEKKTTIQELILMKSIQGELEKEMEETLLNSALLRNS